MIPYGRQNIDDEDIDAVIDVLKSDFLTQGPKVPEFEQHVARYCQVKYAVAVNSATSALHLACLALGVNATSRVWTSAVSFVASANCARYCGAEVDFVDIDPATINLCPQALKKKLQQAEKDNSLPDVVIVVHMAGQPCDMASIHALAKQYDFAVIEDASHAIGSEYQGKKTGSCQFSDITVFSFHPVKIITTAEGGIAVTNKASLAEKMRLLRSHGVTRDAHQMRREESDQEPGSWYYQQLELGFNYRMTDLQAALGIRQLNKLDSYVAQRNQLAQGYHQALQTLPLTLLPISENSLSSFHLYIIQVAAETHKNLFEALRQSGVGVNLHYMPIYLQPYYRDLGFQPGYCPKAEAYSASAISLPLYPGLSDENRDYVCDTLKTLLAKERAI